MEQEATAGLRLTKMKLTSSLNWARSAEGHFQTSADATAMSVFLPLATCNLQTSEGSNKFSPASPMIGPHVLPCLLPGPRASPMTRAKAPQTKEPSSQTGMFPVVFDVRDEARHK